MDNENGWTCGDENDGGKNEETMCDPNIDVEKSKERMYRSSVIILASKKYTTLNIFELKFLRLS